MKEQRKDVSVRVTRMMVYFQIARRETVGICLQRCMEPLGRRGSQKTAQRLCASQTATRSLRLSR